MTVAEIQELAKALRLSFRDEVEAEAFCRELLALEALCAPLLGVTGQSTDRLRARGTDALREDCVGESLTVDALRAMAPVWEDGFFAVPRAIEGGDGLDA